MNDSREYKAPASAISIASPPEEAEPDQPSSEHAVFNGVAASLSDSILKTLYDEPPTLSRVAFERRLLSAVRQHLEQCQENLVMGLVTEEQAATSLARLDVWLDGRLSGRSLLMLINDAELIFPSLIPLMPRVLSARYEEIRVARLWSSLLSPDALARLSEAIRQELEMFNADFDMGDL